MQFLHYIEVSVTIAGSNVLTDRTVGEEIADFIQTANLDLHADVKVMLLFQKGSGVLDYMDSDFDRFEDDLSDKFAKNGFSDACHREGRMRLGSEANTAATRRYTGGERQRSRAGY